MSEHELANIISVLETKPKEAWSRRDLVLNIDYVTNFEGKEIVIQKWTADKKFLEYAKNEARAKLLKEIGVSNNFDYSLIINDNKVGGGSIVIDDKGVRVDPVALRLCKLFEKLDKGSNRPRSFSFLGSQLYF